MRKEVIIYFLGKTIPALFNFLMIILSVKFLGQAKYGEFSLLFNMVMTIHIFTFGWVQQGVLRFLTQNRSLINITINRFFIFINLSSVLGILVLMVFNFYYFHLNILNFSIISAYLILYNLYMFNLTVNQALFKSIRYVYNEILFNLFFIIFLLIFIYANFHSSMIIFCSMLISLVIAVLFFLLKFLKTGRFRYSAVYWNKAFFKKTFNYGIQITIWLSLAYVFNYIDRFIMRGFSSYTEVGIYSAVYDIIFKISTFVCVPILLAYHPRITFEWNNNKKIKSFLLLKKAIWFEVLIFLVVLALFIPFQNLIFVQFLNIKYSGNIYFLSIPIIISGFMWHISILVHKPLELRLKQHIMIIGIFLSLIINVVLNYTLIPRFGFQIAGMNTLASGSFYLLFVLIFFIKQSRLVLKHDR